MPIHTIAVDSNTLSFTGASHFALSLKPARDCWQTKLPRLVGTSTRGGRAVQVLVHPSAYPSVYDRSGVFAHDVVGVSNAIENFAARSASRLGADQDWRAFDQDFCGHFQ